MTHSSSLARIQFQLHAFYKHRFPNDESLRISNLVCITSGWQNEIYTFDYESCTQLNGNRVKLVLRLYVEAEAGTCASEKALHEFQVMQRLFDVGYPIPRVLILEPSTAPLGKPFVIMERFNGHDLWNSFSVSSNDRKQALRTVFCRLFTQLHSIDPNVVVERANSNATDPYYFVDEYLDKERRALQEPTLCELLPIVDWLQARRDLVPCLQPSIVHSDFHYKNVLLGDDDNVAVIDWSGLRISDARFDLGWMLMLQRTHIDVAERNLLLQEYVRLSSTPMPLIEWFETHAALWRVRNVLTLFLHGPEAIGAHSSAVEMAEKNLQPIIRAYEFLTETTSIRSSAIERVFASIANGSYSRV